MSIKQKLKNNDQIVDFYKDLKYLYFKNFNSDQRLLKKQFKKRLNRDLDLDNPIKFNDKLQWLKLNWYNSLATQCADKYEVRKFVEEKIGKQYLNELYAVYDSVDQIEINKLPKSFVLKGTHGSGFNLICKNKDEINWKKSFKRMRKWMNKNYYWFNREWVYKDIKPRIICEKYLEEVDSNQLKDYKFFCFNGEPKLIQVDFDRYSNHKRNIYDLNWNLTDIEIVYPRDESQYIERPYNLELMIELSKTLSRDFPHVRVDFYVLNNNEIYFGELTFFHEAGVGRFNPPSSEEIMGNWLELPKSNS
ncbi:ATP-grasp fold amidoligase family protein [Halobacillus halophilus]|uniref:ATP-grasp fold amidoligase family protein n=1 Tax=Halobacillus halophilus TaxID=1570 RepID=UPI001CD20F12|nr:ATP-grasp fold amidoligase family protein [Halobacillus halophilus]MCA1010723.1 glycosyl transferase [Halobacillus halophilus]